MSDLHPFEQWWSDAMGARMPRSKYLARKGWNAAIHLASEHTVPGGDRQAILALLVPEKRRNAK